MQDCQVAGFLIPKGVSVVYLSYFANRDQSVFPEPHLFNPLRWTRELVMMRVLIQACNHTILNVCMTMFIFAYLFCCILGSLIMATQVTVRKCGHLEEAPESVLVTLLLMQF